MDIDNYKIIVLPSASRKLIEIYDYISKHLYSKNAAYKLMEKIEEKIQSLKISPFIYPEIEKLDENTKRKYRKILVENYIVLYTIDTNNKVIYISNIYHGSQNYLNIL